MLPEFGFTGMEERDADLLAYSTVDEADAEGLKTFVADAGLVYTQEDVQEENWNASWEANFEPVTLPGLIHVRAFFHPRLEGFKHEILITPKMSFGTGHHATTRMMMKSMVDMNFKEKKVLDFGTGTGILAILAVKLGAAQVVAIDNDSWSIDNVKENTRLNDCHSIIVMQRSSTRGLGPVDCVLANINRNVLEQELEALHEALVFGGTLFISGLLQSDYEGIQALYRPHFGKPLFSYNDHDWIALVYQKKHGCSTKPAMY